MTPRHPIRPSRGGVLLKLFPALLAVLLILAVGLVIWGRHNPLALHKRVTRSQLGKAGLERTEVSAQGRRLVLWRGGRGPDLVLLHGSGDQAGAWASVAGELVSDYRVHALDLPGHGDSEPAEGALRMAEIYSGLAAYLGTLDSPPILVGNSMGAWLATLYAHRQPERVARVVLVNGGALLNEPPEGLSLTPATREDARRLMAALRDPASRPIPDYVLDDIVQQSAGGPIGRMMQDLPGMLEHLLDGRLAEISTPVDLVWGASDRLMTLSYAERMAAELPRARLTAIERCGHIPMNECPERFLASLREVLALEPPAPPPLETAPGEMLGDA